MEDIEPDAQLALLTAEMAWLRRLARALLRDGDAADLAQDTWLAAKDHLPADGRPLRPWLSRVARNLAITKGRARQRREAREQASASLAETEPRPDELVQRVELQKLVATEVLALAEPYRSTVLLHFFEGLSSADIARRLGIPDGTVRRRLKTAVDELRARLKGHDGQPDPGWLAALAPLANAAEPAAPTSSLLGGVIVKKIIVLVVVLLLMLAGALWWKAHGHDRSAGHTSTTPVVHLQLRPVGNRHEVGRVPEWAMQASAPGRRIAGHVVSNGKPVPAATVRLGLQVDGDLVQPLAELTATPDGVFDFGVQPAAQFAVSAQAEGHAGASVVVANADPLMASDDLLVVLEDCRWRMEGTVSDASGGGIAKAHLSVDGLGGADTDAAGHYSMCLSPRMGTFDTPQQVVRLEADGYGTTTDRVMLASASHQDFVLVPEAVLVGHVVTADNRPVSGARVIAEPDAIEGPHHVTSNWAESDADGHFRIAGLAPGKFQLSATTRTAGTSAPLLTIARATDTSKELRLVVAPVARVVGRVMLNGSPVAGAHVLAAHPGPGPADKRGPTATSQPDGTFTLDGVAFGTVSLSASPFLLNKPTTLAIDRAQVDNVVLEVSKQATVRGHVFRRGKPVAGAEVQYMPLTPQTVVVKSNAEGAYVLEGLPAGDGSVGAISAQSKAYAEPMPIHLAAGEDLTQDIELTDAGEVQGTVVDEAGKPVPGVYVRMELMGGGQDHCETMSDGHGDFDCTSLAGGEYEPRVAPTASVGQGFAPAAGDTFTRINVPKDGVVSGVRVAIKNQRFAIRGTVLDDTGAPVPDVHVEAIGHGYPVMADLVSMMSDANGKFEIPNLARGTYNLHAHAGDGSETEVLGIATDADPVTITLARPGAIDGTLAGFSTTPTVQTNTLTADLRIGGFAVVDGNTFSQIGLPPGKYTVEAKAGAETDGVGVEVRSGETAHITLTSRGAGRVEGTVIELGTKAPVGGMRCDGNLSMGGQMSGSPPDESRQAFTDPAGHFSLATPTGRVRVFCFAPNGPPMSPAGTDVDVAPGTVPQVALITVRPTFGSSPAKVGFDIVPATLPITVNTVDPSGAAAAAGILRGDHIVSVDGQTMEGMLPAGVQTMLLNHHAGSTIAIVLERSGVSHVVKVTVP